MQMAASHGLIAVQAAFLSPVCQVRQLYVVNMAGTESKLVYISVDLLDAGGTSPVKCCALDAGGTSPVMCCALDAALQRQSLPGHVVDISLQTPTLIADVSNSLHTQKLYFKRMHNAYKFSTTFAGLCVTQHRAMQASDVQAFIHACRPAYFRSAWLHSKFKQIAETGH